MRRMKCFSHKTEVFLITLLFILSIAAFFVHADSTIKFHGTLVVVECNINSGQRQTVDFGSAVGINRIDGKRYEQSVPFVLECKNHAGGMIPPLLLTLEGNPTSFDEAAVLTDVDGLGIEMRSNGVAQPLNKQVLIDYKNLPTLTAVPVADPSVELEARSFSATVKITVEVP